MYEPILFNTEMVRAILDERKTVTRRVIKPQPKGEVGKIAVERYHKPYNVGDVLYVRETWCKYDDDHVIDGEKYAYRANATAVSEEMRKQFGYKWRPSIHMPKDAARIFLRVTDVRVERLQEINADGIINEGLTSMAVHVGDMEIAQSEFALLWNTTVKKSDRDKYGWEANPWVWVIEFEEIEVSK